MSLRYEKVKKSPTIFLRMFGITPLQFETILKELQPLWDKKILGSYKRPGRDFKLPLEDMVLLPLLYYRSYVSQMHVGFLFGLDDSRVCRLIQKLEPLLASVMSLPEKKILTGEDLEVLIDATEQGIERPKENQKAYYSGKKKKHTLKTEMRTSLKGKIIGVSKESPGSVHDFALYKKEEPLPKGVRAYVDGGYQGLDKIHEETQVPFKRTKNKSLDQEEKDYNQALSRIRVKIENVFAQLKTFKILSDRYRNKRKRYHIKFTIIAGIVNLKNGFASF